MIAVHELRKAYGTETVLDACSFTLAAGRCLAVLGASGSGKTTLLRILAGHESADAGSVRLDGREVLGLPPERRGAVYLSQEPLLFPHLDVSGNVAFGPRLRQPAPPWAERLRRWGFGASRESADPADRALRQSVLDLLRELGLEEHRGKTPAQLSGGQRQRAAFGRALILRPRVLLLDEPFASLDAPTRADMQRLYRDLSRRHGITTLLVTHDVREALVLGDDLARLEAGRLCVYPSRAAFVGDPDSGAGAELAFWRAVGEEGASGEAPPPA
jgi:ABC-type Fe3+/spermidine/putrescine transport system ATPase subunit